MHMQRTLVKGTAVLALLAALLAAVLFVTYEPDAQAASAPKGAFQLDLVITVEKDTPIELVVSNIGSSGLDGSRYVVDSFFDVFFVANIGSSGQDGVRASSFNPDSFFDVFFEIEVEARAPGTIQTEMVALSLTGTLSDPSNPGVVLDGVRTSLSGDPDKKPLGTLHYGHVTVLK